jgi:hypothetical protein
LMVLMLLILFGWRWTTIISISIIGNRRIVLIRTGTEM